VTLVDTSVWIEHFRAGNPELADLLMEGSVLMHPLIVGELACRNLPDRVRTLQLLDQLPACPVASTVETRFMVEELSLFGSGLGWVDMNLVASVRLRPAGRLWTLDRRLAETWAQIDDR